MGESMPEGEDFEEAFRALKASIVVALQGALEAAPRGTVWPIAHPVFALRKMGDDDYCVLISPEGREGDRLSMRKAVAFILLQLAQELVNNG